MKIFYLGFTKFFLFSVVVSVSISCNNEDLQKIKQSKDNILLQEKTKDFQYSIFEDRTKVDSYNVEQCEKYLSFKSSSNGFEVYGADIADLFSLFYNVNKSSIDLQNKDAIFYTINYTGLKSDSMRVEIMQKLLSLRKLEVKEGSVIKKVFNLNEIDQDILDKHKTDSKENSVNLNRKSYELRGVNLIILINTLNNLYSNSFALKITDQNFYNFQIPLQIDKVKMIEFLKLKYGIGFLEAKNKLIKYEIRNMEAK